MKRRDFIKALGALGILPALPKLPEGIADVRPQARVDYEKLAAVEGRPADILIDGNALDMSKLFCGAGDTWTEVERPALMCWKIQHIQRAKFNSPIEPLYSAYDNHVHYVHTGQQTVDLEARLIDQDPYADLPQYGDKGLFMLVFDDGQADVEGVVSDWELTINNPGSGYSNLLKLTINIASISLSRNA